MRTLFKYLMTKSIENFETVGGHRFNWDFKYQERPADGLYGLGFVVFNAKKEFSKEIHIFKSKSEARSFLLKRARQFDEAHILDRLKILGINFNDKQIEKALDEMAKRYKERGIYI